MTPLAIIQSARELTLTPDDDGLRVTALIPGAEGRKWTRVDVVLGVADAEQVVDYLSEWLNSKRVLAVPNVRPAETEAA